MVQPLLSDSIYSSKSYSLHLYLAIVSRIENIHSSTRKLNVLNMKGVFILSVLAAVVLSVFASAIQSQTPGDFEDEPSYPADTTQVVPEVHGNRMKRSPLDPIVAPLIVAKSFLYGALLGPKLFRPKYYYKPAYHHYDHGHGYGGSYGWGWGK